MPILYLTRGERVLLDNSEALKVKDLLLEGKDNIPEFVEVQGEPIKVAKIERVSFEDEQNKVTFGQDSDSYKKDVAKIHKGWNAFMKQSNDEKARFWFRYIFGTHYFLRRGFSDKLSSEEKYQELKKQIGKKKMARITTFIRKWYENNADSRWPSFEEYSKFLPVPIARKKIEGWKHITENPPKIVSDRKTSKQPINSNARD